MTGAAGFAGTATTAVHAGSSTITPIAGNLAAANYNFTAFTNGTLTIDTRAVTATADAKGKNYGDADPALTYQVTSGTLVTGDAFTGALTRQTGENAGTYAIQQGTLALSADYTLTYVGSNLTIGQAHLTVVADNQTKTYDGNVFTAFTYHLTGFVNSENATTAGVTGAAGFAGTATTAVHAGSSTITPTAGNLAAANYDFTAFTNGTSRSTRGPSRPPPTPRARTTATPTPP